MPASAPAVMSLCKVVNRADGAYCNMGAALVDMSVTKSQVFVVVKCEVHIKFVRVSSRVAF
jgi:hypothetical protein